jgi:transketolase
MEISVLNEAFDWDVIDILKEMTSNIIAGNDRCEIKNRKENQFVYCCTQRWEWVDFMMNTHAWHGKA